MPTFFAASVKIRPACDMIIGLFGYSFWRGAFERIAAVLHHAAQIAGLARRAAELLEAVEMRLQLVIGDAEILDRQVGGDRVAAIALGQMRAQPQLGREWCAR